MRSPLPLMLTLEEGLGGCFSIALSYSSPPCCLLSLWWFGLKKLSRYYLSYLIYFYSFSANLDSLGLTRALDASTSQYVC